MVWGFPDIILDKIDIFYDRGEQFLRHIDHLWRGGTTSKHPFWQLVNTVAPAKMRETPPLQAADMIAWSSNRLLAGPRNERIDEVCQHVIEATAGWHLILDAPGLQKVYGRVLTP